MYSKHNIPHLGAAESPCPNLLAHLSHPFFIQRRHTLQFLTRYATWSRKYGRGLKENPAHYFCLILFFGGQWRLERRESGGTRGGKAYT